MTLVKLINAICFELLKIEIIIGKNIIKQIWNNSAYELLKLLYLVRMYVIFHFFINF